MDFQKLLQTMRDIDAPTSECMEAPMDASKPESNMNININAHGIDDMQSIMNLFRQVNPDMTIGDEPTHISTREKCSNRVHSPWDRFAFPQIPRPGHPG